MPVDSKIRNTYSSQFVPLPLAIFARANEKDQAVQDSQIALANQQSDANWKLTGTTAEDNAKINDLAKSTESGQGEFLTTNQGLRINDDQNSLKAGERGATLLEDFQLREKITHFDHERIPERIVLARGSAAHGYFELTESISQYTKAKFLQTPGKRTPVFARFSTVAGSRGSTAEAATHASRHAADTNH